MHCGGCPWHVHAAFWVGVLALFVWRYFYLKRLDHGDFSVFSKRQLEILEQIKSLSHE